MKTISIGILAFLLHFFICQCRADDGLQAISETDDYKVEICFAQIWRYMGLDTKIALRDYTEKITYNLEDLHHKRFSDLISVLQRHSPREANPIDVKWSIVIQEGWSKRGAAGKDICTCCFDAWGADGYINGEPVTFSSGTGIWLRKYLAETFELKEEPIETRRQRYVKPESLLKAPFSEFFAVAPLVVGLVGIIIYIRKRRNRKKPC